MQNLIEVKNNDFSHESVRMNVCVSLTPNVLVSHLMCETWEL